jgi:hypothetical protein
MVADSGNVFDGTLKGCFFLSVCLFVCLFVYVAAEPQVMGPGSTNELPLSEIVQKNVTKKKFRKFSVKFVFLFLFLAIMVLRPIWSMPEKIWLSRPASLGGDRERTNST